MSVHELVSDELWGYIEPLLPPRPPRPKGGPPWNPDRPARCGILDVLRTGIQWQLLPTELGCGSGSVLAKKGTRRPAHPGLAGALPPAGDPLRAARRHPPGLPR